VPCSIADVRFGDPGDNPAWRPPRALDDGQEVYIKFPTGIPQGYAGLPAAVHGLECKAARSGAPGIRLERRLQRRFRDAAGIVGDGRGGDHGDHLEQMILAEACG
jgi:hypothetical protein